MKLFALALPLVVGATELTRADVIQADAASMEAHKASYLHVQNKWFNLKQETENQLRSFSPLGVVSQTCTDSFVALEASFACANSTGIGEIFEDNNGLDAQQVLSRVTAYCGTGSCAETIITAMQGFKTACIDSNELSQMCAGASNDPTQCAAMEICHSPLSGTCVLNRQFFANIAAMTQLPCMRGPDGNGGEKFCIPSFYQFIQPVDENSETEAQLQTRLTNGCDLCTLKVFKAWAHFEPFEAGLHFLVLSTFCLKRDGDFCAVKWKQAGDYDNNNPQCWLSQDEPTCNDAARGCKWAVEDGNAMCEDKWTQDKLARGCHPCMFAFLKRMAFLTAAIQRAVGNADGQEAARAAQLEVFLKVVVTLKFLCVSDFQNNFCLAKVENTQFNLDDPTLENPKCDQFAGFVKEQGCCAGSFINLVRMFCAVQAAESSTPSGVCVPGALQAYLTQLQGACTDTDNAWTIPEGCGVQKYKIAVAAVIRNVRRAWWNNNKEAFRNYVIATIAYNTGVEEDTLTDVTISDTAPPGRRLLQADELYVNFGANVGGESEKVAIEDGVGADGNELENYELQKVDAEGLSDPTSAIEFVSAGVDIVENPDPNAPTKGGAMSPAGAVVPSALALAGLCMA